VSATLYVLIAELLVCCESTRSVYKLTRQMRSTASSSWVVGEQLGLLPRVTVSRVATKARPGAEENLPLRRDRYVTASFSSVVPDALQGTS